MKAKCPECGAEIILQPGVLDGEIIVCPVCGVELEVTKGNPPTLELAPEVEEDWGE